ncbi:MAG: HIT domain-containing protein [Verrucomicrobiota bacterium]
MEHLWAPWRNKYIQNYSKESLKGLFKTIAESNNDEENFVLHRGDRVFVMLNKFPYNLGHVLVVPYHAVPDMTDLEKEDFNDLWTTTREMIVLIKKVFKPDGMNVGVNIGASAGAGVPDHVHVHVVPRWLADLNFVTAVGGARVHPGDLPSVYKMLREAIAS